MGDVKVISKIPVVPVALIVSVISLILAFLAGIIYSIVGYATLISIGNTIIAFNNNTTNIVSSVVGSISANGAIFLIIVYPIMVFIGMFIATAIAAIIYNALAPRMGGIQLELE
jgi:hypothetical protein